MWELDYKEGLVEKNWYFWTVVLEKTLENPLDCKIKSANPKGNQPSLFIGRTVAEAEAPVFWLPDAKSWLIRKDSDAEKDWRQEEKGMTEDEMVVWHYQLSGHEFEQALGNSEGQGGLACTVAKSWTWLSDWTTSNQVRSNSAPKELSIFPPVRVSHDHQPSVSAKGIFPVFQSDEAKAESW